MRFLKNGTGLLVLVLLVLIVLPTRGQDDGKPPEKPPAEKKKEPKKPELEDAVRRAMRRVKKVDDQKFMRATVLSGTADDEPVFVVLCEFGTGDVAFFQGGQDGDADQWIFLEKSQLDAVEDAAKRAQHR